MQGDIVGILDNTGTKVVSYSYDSWGNVQGITGTLASTIGQQNPYRYRGYRLDAETGMYYLNARYYAPQWGRFLSPDVLMNTTGELNGYNLYAYAGNNPILYSDDGGFLLDTILDVVSVCVSVYEFAKNPSWKTFGMLVWDVGAAVVPGLPGSYVLKATKGVSKAIEGGTATAKRAPDFVVTPNGDAIPIPKGASGPIDVVNQAGKTTGFSYTGGHSGANGQVSNIRIMDPTPPRGNSPGYPNGYVKYENKGLQGVDPVTGRTLPNSLSHFRLK